MREIVLFLSLGAFLTGCPDTKCLVRDPVVYQVEMDFMEQASLHTAQALEESIRRECSCVDGKFTTEWCRKAADLVVTVNARVPWHKNMSLYLGGIRKTRPSKEPPKIPAPETLCPRSN